jgi:hypothetical protein
MNVDMWIWQIIYIMDAIWWVMNHRNMPIFLVYYYALILSIYLFTILSIVYIILIFLCSLLFSLSLLFYPSRYMYYNLAIITIPTNIYMLSLFYFLLNLHIPCFIILYSHFKILLLLLKLLYTIYLSI